MVNFGNFGCYPLIKGCPLNTVQKNSPQKLLFPFNEMPNKYENQVKKTKIRMQLKNLLLNSSYIMKHLNQFV